MANSSSTADKMLDVFLTLMGGDQELGVTEIAQIVDMDKAQVHRYLTSLRAEGFAVLNSTTHRYSMGVRALQIASAFVKQFDLPTIATPFLRKLRDASGETACLATRVANHRVHLIQAESHHEIYHQFPMSTSLPIHCGAAGQCLLAFSNNDLEVDRILDGGLEKLTPSTITDPVVLRQVINEVKERGYATSLGQRVPGSRSIAAPVWSWRGDLFALVVSGPSLRFTKRLADNLVPLVTELAGSLSSGLGSNARGGGGLRTRVETEKE